MQMPKGWQNMAQLAGKDEDDAEIKYEVEFRLPEGGAGIGSFRRLGLDIKYFQKKNLDTLCALCKRYGMSVEDQQKIGTGIDGKRDCISYLSDHPAILPPARPPAGYTQSCTDSDDAQASLSHCDDDTLGYDQSASPSGGASPGPHSPWCPQGQQQPAHSPVVLSPSFRDEFGAAPPGLLPRNTAPTLLVRPPSPIREATEDPLEHLWGFL